MNKAERRRFSRMCLWLAKGRWIYLFGVFSIGIITKLFGNINVSFNFELMAGIVAAVGISNVYFSYFFKNSSKRSDWALKMMASLPLLLDLVAITIVAHYAGGIESISFLFYIYVILAASFIFAMWGAFIFATLASISFAGLVVAEHLGYLIHRQRYFFKNPVFQDFNVAFINSLTIAISFFIAALFAGFVATLLRRQERRLWSEKNKNNSIIQSLADGILVLNKKGEIIHSNQRLKDILGIKKAKEKLKNHPFTKYEKAFSQYLFSVNELNQLQECTIQNPIIKTFSLLKPKEKFLKIVSLPLRENGKITGIIRIVRDQTREKILDKIKSDFISIAAHQLRTPLSELKWGFKALLGDNKEKLTKNQKYILEQSQTSNEKLIKLVEDLLSISTIEEGRYQFNFQETWLDEIIEEAIEETKIIAKKESVAVVFQRGKNPLPKLQLDRQKFKLALVNLIDNAIKYSPENEIVLIKTEMKPNTREVQILIIDKGIGIAEEERGIIFSKFFRGERAMRKKSDGNGLGLFIVKNIIDEHNGKIWFKSKEGKGTTFIISLPLETK